MVSNVLRQLGPLASQDGEDAGGVVVDVSEGQGFGKDLSSGGDKARIRFRLWGGYYEYCHTWMMVIANANTSL